MQVDLSCIITPNTVLVNINWQQMLTTIGGGTAMLLASAWLIRTIVLQGLAREAEKFRVAVQAKADREIEEFKTKLQSDANLEIERLKNELQIAADERRVQFARLHETRARHIARLYKNLVAISRSCQEYVFQMNEDQRRSGFQALEIEFRKLYEFIETIRIYLPERISDLLDNLWSAMRSPAIKFFVFGAINEYARPEMQQQRSEELMKAIKAFDEDIPVAKKALENEFRDMLGVYRKPPSGENTTHPHSS